MKFIFLVSIFFLVSACGGDSSSAITTGSTQTEREGENNDNSTAQSVGMNSTISGTLDMVSDKIDVFSFTISSQKALDITLSGPAETDFDLKLSNSDGAGLKSSFTDESEEEISTLLAAGKYYVEVEAFDGSGAYALSIMAGRASVFLDQVSVCFEINDLSKDLATGFINGIYDSGQCGGSYKYKCEIEVEGLDGLIFYTETVSYSDALTLCDDKSGRFITL